MKASIIGSLHEGLPNPLIDNEADRLF